MSCPKCGANDFHVYESITNKAMVDEENVLSTYSFADNEITGIECANCGKEFEQEDFEDIQFNS
jgi:predicted nucleic-acid-binding Zn-ribbon protein